jgi:hypothetical protein
MREKYLSGSREKWNVKSALFLPFSFWMAMMIHLSGRKKEFK